MQVCCFFVFASVLCISTWMLCWTLEIFCFLNQVLSSLQPLDYIVVAFLPGISEVKRGYSSWLILPFLFIFHHLTDITYYHLKFQELLFRGAILPLLGMNWNSIAIAALIFGVLHLGNGPNYSFAIWCISFPFPLSFLSCPPFFSFSSLCCLFLFPRISGNYHIYPSPRNWNFMQKKKKKAQKEVHIG